MRLHTLTISAFGSFSDRASVDFDQLSTTGLFLLHGPTGAGKTTILDAISFALFGTVPGVRTAGEALRSHHASGETVTEVELEVTLDGRRYRIVRRPKQQRPKLRGDGLREHPSSATVQELVDGSWVVRASKPNEADPYLQDHLHMEADQFHQIVMLPQGDFARFLRASADERRNALEELFGTHRFTEVERWLRTHAETTRRALRDADEQARRILVSAATVAEVAPFDDDRPLIEATAWVAALADAARDRAELAVDLEQQRRCTHEQARTRLASTVELRARQQRHAAAQAESDRLSDTAREQVERKARRDLALRAAPIAPLIDMMADAASRLRGAAARRRSAADELAEIAPHLAEVPFDQLVSHDEVLIGQLATVTGLLDDERSLECRQQHLAEVGHQLMTLSDQRARLDLARRAVPAERIRLDQLLVSARDSASRLDHLVRFDEQLAARQLAAVQRDRLGELVSARADEIARLRTDALDAREHWLDLLERHLAGLAAAMAADLEPGDACPVCGSADHPLLAIGSDAAITDQQVANARERAELADQALHHASDATADVEQQLATATATAGDASVGQLTDELAEHRRLLEQARAGAADEPQLQTARHDLDEHDERMSQLLETADREVAATSHDRALLEADIATDQLRITEARAGFATLADRSSSLQAVRRAIAALVEADHTWSSTEDLHVAAVRSAEGEAAQRAFPSIDHVEAALLDEHQLSDLVSAIEGFDRTVAETEATLADPQLAAAATEPLADLDQAETEAHEAERDWDLASTAAATARACVDKLCRTRADLDQRMVALAPLAESYEQARQLADLASGDDRQVEHRMRLSTYVLAARLEQVAAAASERLSRMSGGRFTIVHTDEAPDGRRKGGLGLRVVDAWTSTHRETATLSGGESFFTSLALALGVADVVSAEAGGLTIDTMFIDEGFGSLDEDTLQQVLDVIDGLRAGGRTIGIVSHVADLRDRITTQLEVIKGPEGSSLRTTVAPLGVTADSRFDRRPTTIAAEPDADEDAA